MIEKCDKEYIMSLIPHREPMLLIDECEILEDGSVNGHYTIKEDEFFTRGHFPGNPIVPGVIQCEIMAQTCSMLVRNDIPGHIALYAGLDKVRFKNQIKPGDVCDIHAILNETRECGTSKMFFCSATLSVRGKLCCKAEMTFALLPQDAEV